MFPDNSISSSELGSVFEPSSNQSQAKGSLFEQVAHNLASSEGVDTLYKYGVNTVFSQFLPPQSPDAVSLAEMYRFPTQFKKLDVNGWKGTPADAETFQSVLPQELRQRVGLLRSPLMNESFILSTKYNESMATECLKLAGYLRSLFKANEMPNVVSLWEVARSWRLGRLNASLSTQDEVFFSKARIGNPGAFLTPINNRDPKYAHLIPFLTKCANEPSCSIQKAQGLSIQNTTWDGSQIRCISLQHRIQADKRKIALTEIRLALNNQNQPVLHPWTNFMGSGVGRHAVIIHTDGTELSVLVRLLQDKLEGYIQFLKVDLKSEPLKQDLRLPAIDNPQDVSILKKLGSLHYLLAQSALDLRGSAAKSEFMIRALAASAGLELKPFKKGFVPDLEAFINMQSTFVENYPHSFE